MRLPFMNCHTGLVTKHVSIVTSAASVSATRAMPAKSWSQNWAPRSYVPLGITPEIREDHADYIGHWLNVLAEDNRAIFQAAAHAQRAADFLQGLQPTAPSGSPSSQ